MNALALHEFHQTHGARFGELAGAEVVLGHGDWSKEHAALHETAGLLDLSFRSRICLVGADRSRFLNGQVTNNIKDLKPGNGCYAALTNNKGKLQSDLNIHALADELLLDFEPGLTAKVIARLEQFIVADDVQVVDVASHYGLLSVQGPLAADTVASTRLFGTLPEKPFQSIHASLPDLGELYLANLPRVNSSGFDLYVPTNSLAAVAEKLSAAAKAIGGCACGWQSLETARIEAGVPRFGADMDESNLPQETGIEARAVSYTKGCYIGQEVINRIRSFGQVTRALRGLEMFSPAALPAPGDKLWHAGKEVGHLTSAVKSPRLGKSIALGYVRKECNTPGTELTVRSSSGEIPARIVPLPFVTTK